MQGRDAVDRDYSAYPIGSLHQAETVKGEGAHHPIDPFGAMPDQASLIAGLGGREPSVEPGYVFAMLPVIVRPGRAAISVRFDDLRADGGSITLDLAATPAARDGVAVRISSKLVSLTALAAGDGTVMMEFFAEPDQLYAVSAAIYGRHHVEATGIAVALIERGDADGEAEHGSDGVGASVQPSELLRLANLGEPSFVNPVSQPMTRTQLQSRACQRWLQELSVDSADDASAWTEAYVLQVLRRYGALAPGAHGLGINVGGQAVPALLAAQGCSVTVMEHDDRSGAFDPQAAFDRLSRPSLCADARLRSAVQIAGIDMRAPEIRIENFDFAWSVHLTPTASFEHLFWFGLHRVKPGGLYVHICGYDRHDGSDPRFPTRARIEREALNAISFGNDVAELKFRLPTADRPRGRTQIIPYALIIRHVTAQSG